MTMPGKMAIKGTRQRGVRMQFRAENTMDPANDRA